MDQPALIDLTTAGMLSASQVGEQALQLAKLQKRGLPIAPTAVIPRRTLELIVYQTNLVAQLKKVLSAFPHQPEQQATLSQKIKNTLRNLSLPQTIIKEILAWANQHPGFLRVSVSSNAHPKFSFTHENISGDANLIDSIMTIWAEQISLDLERQKLELYARPILIQQQGQAEISGVALTHLAQQKSWLQIFSTWGVYDSHHPEIKPDVFEIDIRAGNIVKQQLFPQYLMLQRQRDTLSEKTLLHYKQQQFSLNKNQVLELAGLIAIVRRSIYEPQLVSWFYQNGKFYLTQTQTLPELTANTNLGKVILSGDTYQAGIASGETFILTHKSQLKKIALGQVVVIKELTADYLPALKKATAIICDQGLANPLLAKHLQKYGVPTLINTRHATRYLRSGLSITVDANTGTVSAAHIPTTAAFFKSTPSNSSTITTATKVYISAGNPQKAQKYVSAPVDGIGVLRSEYTFAHLGKHPSFLFKNKKENQLKTAIKKTIQAYQATRPNLPVIYRSIDLTSQEFQALEHASGFEPNEPNPYLGFRGGLRMISNFKILDLETTALIEILATNSTPLGLMLPFVRTFGELHLIINHLNKYHQLQQQPKLNLYLQLNTPENILQLKHYLHPTLKGISINVRSLQALLHGVDPDNNEIYALYPTDTELMKNLLTIIMQTVQVARENHLVSPHDFKTMLHLENYNLQLLEFATNLGFEIITVKPEFAFRAKQRISEVEAEISCRLKSN